MNKYKLTFEKTYSDKCLSKNRIQEITIESDIGLDQIKVLSKIGRNKLINEFPLFYNSADEMNSHGWSQPEIKSIFLVDQSE